MSWLSGYQYRKLITISGSAGAGSGYQVLLRVGESANADADFHLEGHALNFPNDIRFTAADGVTELAHWLEKVEGVAPDRTAYFWVKVEDSLDVDVQIYCYYGQEGGASASDGEQTFEAYDLTTFTEYDPNNRFAVNNEQSVTVTDLGGRDDAYLVKSITQQSLALEHNIEITAMSKYTRFHIGFADTAASFKDITNGFSYLAIARDAGNYHALSIVDSGSMTNSNVIEVSLNTKYYVRIIYDGANAQIKIYDDAQFSNLLGQLEATAPTPFNYVGLFGHHNTTLPISGELDATIDLFRVRKFIDPEPSFSSAGAEETAVVYVSSSLSDSYKLLNFAGNLASGEYRIFNFAANLASDQYKLLALLEKLLSDVYSIRTFTSRTLLDSYAIISGIAVREVIVLRSKITREMNLTSRVIREVLLRSKLS